MKKVVLSLTDEEKDYLEDIAKSRDTTPNKLVEAFVSDLVCSNRSGGSDERTNAYNWLARQTCRW